MKEPPRGQRHDRRSADAGGTHGREGQTPTPDARQRNQDLLASIGIRQGTSISHPSDGDEREADRAAEAFVAGRPNPLASGGPPSARVRRCASCEEDGAVHRKAESGTPRPAAPARAHLSGSRGAALGPEARAPYEHFFGRDFSDVRVHDDDAAHAAASALQARAFAKGRDVYLGAGALDGGGDGGRGRRLIAHELAHVAQEGGGARVRRQSLASSVAGSDPSLLMSTQPDPSSLSCRAEPAAAEPQMCMAPPTAGLPDSGALAERVAAFKAWVKQVAIQRLYSNRVSLSQWATLIHDRLPDDLIAAAGLSQSGGYGTYVDLQDVHNPFTREVMAYQAAGRYRACTGCHLLNEAWGRGAAEPHVGSEWLSPNERRAGASAFAFPSLTRQAPLTPTFPIGPAGGTSAGYVPPAGTAEGRLMSALPHPSRVLALMEQARPILAALGPGGFQVLPQRLLDDIETRPLTAVRREIIATIEERRGDYLTLIGMIQSGDVSYDKFGPIIQDLLPLAAPDVRDVIQQEMDSNRFWNGVRSIAIGILTIAALILIVFPPTTALGIAVAGAIDLTLAGYAIATAPEQITTGHAYTLGTGANTVFSPEQQQAGGLMMLTGFVGAVLAPLGLISGAGRLATGLEGLTAVTVTTTAALRVGQTIQRGEYLVTLMEDGSLVATSTRQADLLIIVRGDTATLYQSMGPGGLRVIGSQSLSELAGVSDAVEGGQSAATASMRSGPAALPAGRTPLLLTSGARTPADEYADFLRMLEGEGGSVPRSGEPVSLQPHRGAGGARQQLGLTGDSQSAHGLAQSVGRGVPGYDPEAALTILEQRAIHRGMDAGWKQAFQALRRSGRTTASGDEIYDAIANSFRNAPGLPPGVGETLAQRLQDEMFVEFGMSRTAQYPLPYPNIGP